MSENVADVGGEKGQRERTCIAVAHAYVAWRHGKTQCVFAHVAPQILLVFYDFSDNEFYVFSFAAGKHLHAVLVDRACFHSEWFAVGGCGGDAQAVGAQIVLDYYRGVGFERISAFEFFCFALACRGGAFVGKACVDTLKQGDFVVECFEIKASVGCPRRLVRNSIAQPHAVHFRSAVPSVSGIVCHGAVEHVEDGYFREWSLVLSGERLVVAPWSAH